MFVSCQKRTNPSPVTVHRPWPRNRCHGGDGDATVRAVWPPVLRSVVVESSPFRSRYQRRAPRSPVERVMESPMSMLEAGLRGGTVAILLLVAILFLRDSGRTPAGRNSALFLLSAVGYVICSAPGVASLDTPLGLSLLAVSLGHPALFWIWAAATFDDEFKPSWRRGFAWLGLVALGMWSLLDSQPIVGFAYYALSLLFVSLAAWHALAGRETDLVEARRRLRKLLAVSAASYGAVLIVTDVVSPGSSVSAPFSIVNAAGLATMTFAIALLWLGIAYEASAVSPT